ncbi:hypothetical protein CCR75_002833 [Bremia lactucae]|uniref:Heat shock protein 70 n=1 Tax=Bremia lactucae TaxID=4779 RepID=A0A976IGW3_BRELC|nr:hypothetical protein CCR75_002833 [Bremia lactucae]
MGSEANESGVVPYEFSVKKLENNDHDGVCFKLNLHNQPECVAPLEIGTAIVRHLRSMACQFVGHEQITKAVIAVPVDFNAKQRNATKAAFEAAGLVVSRILEEPTAAAIAYGLHQDPNVSFLLVFDFGGGTLDVSLLFARNDAITVLDTVGDNHLGGEDLDVQLSAWLVQQFEAQIGTAITSRGGTETYRTELAHGLNEPPCTLAGVRQVAELAKRQLSDETVTTAACAWSDRGQVVRPVVELTRSQFESLCLPLLERTMIPVLDILEANNMATDEIDAVVVVGGSSRIPWVLERLTDIFQGRAPLSDIDPDLAVALGAARTLD